MIIVLSDHEKWLEERKKGLGASDAGTILGVNKWKTNHELWEEKVGLRQAEDISDKPYVKYGHDAEPHIRGLFALDYPEFKVTYKSPYKIIRNDEDPFIFCTPDGELEDLDTGRHGGLEIKTTEIRNSRQWAEWDDRIPDQYYAQVLHQMLAADWDFVMLRALIRYTTISGQYRFQIRDYHIQREEVLEDIKHLREALRDFWEHVETQIPPALILPNI